MNELKPEDVMRALEKFASLNNCNNMRYLEGCGHFCKVLREPIDDMAGGRSPKCNEHCEHYSPPRDEEVFRAALALLREKDAEIEELTDDNKWSAKRIIETDKLVSLLKAEVERLNKANQNFAELENGYIVTGYKNIRAEAITEFAERLKYTLCVNNEENTEVFDYSYTLETIDQIAKEMKGD